ncbi:twitching motility protein PilT [Lachnospiraceae bacterium XBD2001]|jgi:twitching motility protein PilT|nr:twitching motility protein PilT [Lachnospiraceae bacterium XBD2001]
MTPEEMEQYDRKTTETLQATVDAHASDIFIVAGRPISYRKHGSIRALNDERLMPDATNAFVESLYRLANQRDIRLLDCGDDDFSIALPGIARFRVSAYKQRGSMSAVLRIIAFQLPDPTELGIPPQIIEMGNDTNGMVLVTGPAGSGKSTTLACMIDHINQTQNSHIITLEDPIEYLHRHNQSIVSQRELNVDTESFVSALRAALRQSPDVILLGEMRDFETISVAMTAAETGHLLLSTLHTIGASNTINRIVDVFPANQQHQIAVQLSCVLNAVVSQQLLPTVDGGIVPAFEIMTITPAIRNMIRDNKIYQIDGVIYSTSGNDNMISMDNSIKSLYQRGRITKETALTFAVNPDRLGI